jgi:hypothetical protein
MDDDWKHQMRLEREVNEEQRLDKEFDLQHEISMALTEGKILSSLIV